MYSAAYFIVLSDTHVVSDSRVVSDARAVRPYNRG